MSSAYLPGFFLFLLVVILVGIVVAVEVFVVFIDVFVEVAVIRVDHETGSVTGLGFGGAGGGYVVQKWRPHLLQTQN